MRAHAPAALGRAVFACAVVLALARLVAASYTFNVDASGLAGGESCYNPSLLIDEVNERLVIVSKSAAVAEASNFRLAAVRCTMDGLTCEHLKGVTATTALPNTNLDPSAALIAGEAIVAVGLDTGGALRLTRCALDGTACSLTVLAPSSWVVARLAVDMANRRLVVVGRSTASTLLILGCDFDGSAIQAFDLSATVLGFNIYYLTLAVDAATSTVQIAVTHSPSLVPWLVGCSLHNITHCPTAFAMSSVVGHSPSIAIDAVGARALIVTRDSSAFTTLYICALGSITCSSHDLSSGSTLTAGLYPKLLYDPAGAGSVLVAYLRTSVGLYVMRCSSTGSSCVNHGALALSTQISGTDLTVSAALTATGRLLVVASDVNQRALLLTANSDVTSPSVRVIGDGAGKSGASPRLALLPDENTLIVASAQTRFSYGLVLSRCALDGLTPCTVSTGALAGTMASPVQPVLGVSGGYVYVVSCDSTARPVLVVCTDDLTTCAPLVTLNSTLACRNPDVFVNATANQLIVVLDTPLGENYLPVLLCPASGSPCVNRAMPHPGEHPSLAVDSMSMTPRLVVAASDALTYAPVLYVCDMGVVACTVTFPATGTSQNSLHYTGLEPTVLLDPSQSRIYVVTRNGNVAPHTLALWSCSWAGTSCSYSAIGATSDYPAAEPFATLGGNRLFVAYRQTFNESVFMLNCALSDPTSCSSSDLSFGRGPYSGIAPHMVWTSSRQIVVSTSRALRTGDPVDSAWVSVVTACGSLAPPANGIVALTAPAPPTTSKLVATVTCNAGFAVGGPVATQVCDQYGVWLGSTPVCARGCQTAAVNGGVLASWPADARADSPGLVANGSVVALACDTSDAVASAPNATCVLGSWVPELSTVMCEPRPIDNDSTGPKDDFAPLAKQLDSSTAVLSLPAYLIYLLLALFVAVAVFVSYQRERMRRRYLAEPQRWLGVSLANFLLFSNRVTSVVMPAPGDSLGRAGRMLLLAMHLSGTLLFASLFRLVRPQIARSSAMLGVHTLLESLASALVAQAFEVLLAVPLVRSLLQRDQRRAAVTVGVISLLIVSAADAVLLVLPSLFPSIAPKEFAGVLSVWVTSTVLSTFVVSPFFLIICYWVLHVRALRVRSGGNGGASPNAVVPTVVIHNGAWEPAESKTAQAPASAPGAHDARAFSSKADAPAKSPA